MENFKIDPSMTNEENIDAALQCGAISFHSPKYSEPGYSCEGKKGILFANWNRKSTWDPDKREHVTTDDTMPRLAEMAEEEWDIEWDDEWTLCASCMGAYRTQGDSYGWLFYGNEDLCGDCIKEDATEYLIELEGESRKAVTLPIDLEKYDYKKLNEDALESGYYGGQNDSPEATAKTLRGAGVTRFLFKLDDVGQFDCKFSVYAHEEEYDEALKAFKGGNTKAAEDPATVLERGLKAAAKAMSEPKQESGIRIVQIGGDGTVSSKTISSQDFIEGKAFDKTTKET